jgi:hypothetical protein
MSHGPGPATVLLSDPGWFDARDVRAGDLSVGWRTNGPGRLSFRLPSKTAHTLGWDDLKGRWVWAPMGWLGYWGGVIEDDPGDISGGTVEVSAVSFAAMLYWRVTPRTYRQITGSAGAVIARFLKDTARERPLSLDTISVDEFGPAVNAESRGSNLGQEIQSLANGAGGSWEVTVDEDRKLAFTYRVEPSDQRGRIRLLEGYNVVAGSIRPSISRIVNDLLAVANDRNWQRSGGARVEHGSSIREYGRRQDTKRYAGHTRRSSLEAVARADLARLALPTAGVSLEIPATNPVLQDLRVGQLVQLRSYTVNRDYAFDVAAMAYEGQRGTVTVVGTAVEV